MSHWVKKHALGYVLHLIIQPNSSKTTVIGPYGNPKELRLKIKIAAPPTDNRANELLLDFLKSKLKVKKSDLTILRGASARQKDVLCQDKTKEEIEQLLITPKTI